MRGRGEAEVVDPRERPPIDAGVELLQTARRFDRQAERIAPVRAATPVLAARLSILNVVATTSTITTANAPVAPPTIG
jgi:hypothetical protein